jgi:hypothetical protein
VPRTSLTAASLEHQRSGSRTATSLDRRFGALAAGLGRDDPEEMYELDLLTGSRETDMDRTMAEAFVAHALELGGLNQR